MKTSIQEVRAAFDDDRVRHDGWAGELSLIKVNKGREGRGWVGND